MGLKNSFPKDAKYIGVAGRKSDRQTSGLFKGTTEYREVARYRRFMPEYIFVDRLIAIVRGMLPRLKYSANER
jgi:hypothetical protein